MNPRHEGAEYFLQNITKRLKDIIKRFRWFKVVYYGVASGFWRAVMMNFVVS